jgi:hypothetical protein
VYSSDEKLANRAQLRARQRFRFVLPEGTYELRGGPGCPAVKVRVTAGGTMLANVVCHLP